MMLRLSHVVIFTSLFLLAGCNRQAAELPKKDQQPLAQLDPQRPDVNVGDPLGKNPGAEPGQLPITPLFAVDDKQDRYETALTEALGLLGDRKYQDALVAMETARTFQDSEFIKGEIAKLKQRIDQDQSAQATVRNIETILEEGKASEAAKLASAALKEFGGRDDGMQLVKLRLQADALQSVQKNEDPDARSDRFREEGDAALAEKNLRAAALAYEQALYARPDVGLEKKLDDVRGRLERYDALRRRANELRHDPQQLDEALAALQEAQKTWDTVQVRVELDEYALALQKRRETVSVADFELRTDLGLPEAGRSIAEDLLPRLKPRFDLVERSQLNKVLDELKLEQSFLDDLSQQREIGRLAKVRYLVLGSVYRLGGITVQARLVDVRTGLVVQTAKIIAPTPEGVFGLLPELARQLMMNDDEKMAYDLDQQRQAQRPTIVNADAPLPPPPPPPPPGPAPIVIDEIGVAPPPDFGGLRVDVFKNLAPAPQLVGAPPPPPVFAPIAQGEVVVKQRLLQVAVQRGDFFFRIGRFQEAHRQFDFALNLDPNQFDVRLRLDQCRPLVPPPPPPVVVVVPQPVIIAPRPRVALLNFLVVGDPRVVPPTLSFWTPQQLTPYFREQYDIVDSAEVYWYMGRLGMTMNDLMTDPAARRWLGRAVGVRYFVMGTVEQTASFDVSTYLLDAEFGYLQGTGRIHVHSGLELKLRTAELAQLTLMNPAERTRFLNQGQEFDVLVKRGRRHMEQREFTLAVNVFDDALRIRPGFVEVQVYLNQSRQMNQRHLLEEQRRQQFIAHEAAHEAARRRQHELAHAAEFARSRALQDAALFAEDQHRLRAEQRIAAQGVLVKQGQVAFKLKNFGVSVNIFESAAALAPRQAAFAPAPLLGQPDPYRELALARAAAEKDAQVQQAQLAAQQEAALRQQREQELEQARVKLQQQQKRLEQERLAQRQRDEDAYTKSMNEGQRLLNAKNFDGAVAAFQGALRLKKTAAADQLLELALDRQSEAHAKNDAERKELARKLDLERERRKTAEAEAKHNQELYKLALQLADKALAEKRYEIAQAKFEEAGKLYRTDIVLTGLRRIETARAQEDAQAKKDQAQQKKAQRVQAFITQGQAALEAKDFTAAAVAFQQAKTLAPDNLDALAGLARAEQTRDRALADARRKGEEAERTQNFQRMLKSGQDALSQKQYAVAVANLSAAVKLNPTDAAAQQALKQAEKARDGAEVDAKAQAEAKVRIDSYQKLLAEGRVALNGKRYDDAIKAFADAQKLLPGDGASKGFLADAQKAKLDATNALALAAQKRADELKRADNVRKELTLGRTALASKDLAVAAQAFAKAKQLAPENADVARALLDLEAAQKAANAAALAKQNEQRQYQQMLAAGKDALADKDFPSAVKAFKAATDLVPADKAAQELLKQAQSQIKAAATATAQTERVQGLLKTGQAALKAKDYPAAAKALGDASQLDAKNVAVQQALRDLDAARKGAVDSEKRLAAYQQALTAGQKAYLAKDYAEAVQSLGVAVKLMPDDARAQKLLDNATTAWEGAKQAQADEAQKLKLEQQRKATFGALIKQADAALIGKRHADAKKLYEDALRLAPNDAGALRGLREAISGLDPGKTKTPAPEPKKVPETKVPAPEPKKVPETKVPVPEPKKVTPMPDPKTPVKPLPPETKTAAADPKKTPEAKAPAVKPLPPEPKTPAPEPKKTAEPKGKDVKSQLQQQLQDAAKLETQAKWSDAMKSYQEALKLDPKDTQATAGLRRATFNRHVSEGQKHMAAKRFAEAVSEFDAALVISPSSVTLQKLHAEAKKQLKK